MRPKPNEHVWRVCKKGKYVCTTMVKDHNTGEKHRCFGEAVVACRRALHEDPPGLGGCEARCPRHKPRKMILRWQARPMQPLKKSRERPADTNLRELWEIANWAARNTCQCIGRQKTKCAVCIARRLIERIDRRRDRESY